MTTYRGAEGMQAVADYNWDNPQPAESGEGWAVYPIEPIDPLPSDEDIDLYTALHWAG